MKLVKIEKDYTCNECVFAVEGTCLLNIIEENQENKVDLNCLIDNKNYIFKLEKEK